MKAEHFDRKTLQLTVLQLQIDFALLRYLLFSSVGTIPISDTSVTNSATRPLINPNPNPNHNPTSTAHLLPCTDEPELRRSTPVSAVGPPREKTNNSAIAVFQPTSNTQEDPPITTQNLTSGTSKLEKLIADEISTYTCVTAGIHSQNVFLDDKVRLFEAGYSEAIIWKNPSVNFVFDSAKVARPLSDPLIERATSFSSPVFRTHPHGYNIFVKFYPYGFGAATGKCASILFTLFPGDHDNLLQGPFQKLVHIGIRDQLDPQKHMDKINSA